MQLPLSQGAYERRYAREPVIQCLNRFFETNPTNAVAGSALIGRPATTLLVSVGTGPIRQLFSQDGVFSDALFAVSGTALFKIDTDLTVTPITGTISGTGTPSMAATRNYLFIANGAGLLFFDPAGSHATGTLTVTANPADTETVTINGTVYTFKDTMTTLYDVQRAATAADSLQNLADAINAQPETESTNYYVGTPANAFVVADTPTATTLKVIAKVGGTAGNAYTTTETLSNGSWGGATLTGGAPNTLSGITTPDDVGIVSLCVLNGYVLLAVANSDRIYFIRPGELVIRPLDFFTAETQPDQVISLMTVGDQFWAFGSSTTQPFQATGDADLPFRAIQGRGLAYGSLEGTAALIDDNVILVGEDNIVYQYAGGATRVSHSGIEELIRTLRELERNAP